MEADWYAVLQYWQEKGLNKGGFLVCKFAFVVGRLALRSTVLAVLMVRATCFPSVCQVSRLLLSRTWKEKNRTKQNRQ